MSKLEKTVFYAFIFLLPFQIGRFVFSFAPLELFFYHQAFVYLSDILIFGLLGFWGRRILKDKQERNLLFDAIKKDIFLILFFVISGISIFVATNKGLAIFHFVKLFEFALFYFYIRLNFKYIDIKKFSWVFIGTALAQVFIVDLQFHFQQSIGGILRYLGESSLSPAISGVAKIDENGIKLIRGYGTFPHPNILASFLIFAAFIILAAANDALSNASLMRHKINDALRSKMTHLFIIFAVLLGLFLTFSKIALASFIAVCATLFGFLYFKNTISPKSRIYKVFFATFIIFTSLFIVFNQEIFARLSEEQSILQRIFYSDISLGAIASSPILGIGIGNFVDYFHSSYPALPEWQYQPVHNLFLLIVSETGVIGGFLFIMFIAISSYRFFKNKNNQIFNWITFFIFINFLILANFDHYFWTLQQGQVLFWLTLGLLNSRQ